MSAPRVVVFAYSDIGHASLALLLERGARVAAVYTHTDTPGEHLWFPSVAKLAAEHDIPVQLDADLRQPRELSDFTALAPDLILSFYYREIIPQPAIDVAKLGAFNMHGSLLPKYRGRAPVNWAVALGEKETGATLHVMTKLADAGDIVDQESVPIGADDTAFDVHHRVRDAAIRVLDRQLPALLAGNAPHRPQDNSAATKFGRRRAEDGVIDWTRPAADLHNLVRAVAYPYPGAFAKVNGATLHIWRTARAEAPARESRTARAAPGTIRPDGPRAFAVAGDGKWLEILRAQVDDGPALEGAALAERLTQLTTSSGTKPA